MTQSRLLAPARRSRFRRRLTAFARRVKEHARLFAYSIYFLVIPLGLQFSSPTTADEAGVSVWLPGQYGSFAPCLRRRACHLKVPITMRQATRVTALVLLGVAGFKTA